MRLFRGLVFTSLYMLIPSLLFANSMSGIAYIILWGAEIGLFFLYIITGFLLWLLIRKNFVSKWLHYFNMLLLAAGVSAAVLMLIVNILILIADMGSVVHHLAMSVFFIVFLSLAGWFCISKSIIFLRMCREKFK